MSFYSRSLQIFCFAFVAAGLTEPTSATADGYDYSPAPAVTSHSTNWTGFYVGANAGWAGTNYDNAYTVGTSFESDSDTGLFGGHVGYQHQMGNLVIGVEALGAWASNDDRELVQCPNPATRCSGVLGESLWSVGPRLGYAVHKWLPYVTGGYAEAEFDHVVVNGAGAVTRQANDREGGWYIGGGVEYALTSNLSVGVEYRRYDFDFTSERFIVPGGAVDPGDQANVDAEVDTVTARVSFKFGARDEVAPLK